MIPKDRIAHFWSWVDKSGTCWLWTGSKTTAGYGNLAIAQKWYYAHRLAYELEVGPIPKGLVLDHLCRVRHCCNPDHLEAVTGAENTRRGLAPYGLRTTCKNGHDITDEAAVYVAPRGDRRRRICALEYSRARAGLRNAYKRQRRAELKREAS